MEQRYGCTCCPVCNAVRESLLCTQCGFDESSNYEKHFTLRKLSPQTPSVELRKREWLLEPFKMIYCPSCSGTRFSMNLGNDVMNWYCSECGSMITSDQIQDQRNKFTEKRNQIMQGLIDCQSRTAQVQDSILMRHHLRTAHRHLATGHNHFTVIYKDGTVSVFGNQNFDEAFLKTRDIASVAIGRTHIVALQGDNTVISAGDTMMDKCDVSAWKDVYEKEFGIKTSQKRWDTNEIH